MFLLCLFSFIRPVGTDFVPIGDLSIFLKVKREDSRATVPDSTTLLRHKDIL